MKATTRPLQSSLYYLHKGARLRQVDDPEALGNVLWGLYGTEMVPTGIRRSSDGYYHGQGEGRESEREIPSARGSGCTAFPVLE